MAELDTSIAPTELTVTQMAYEHHDPHVSADRARVAHRVRTLAQMGSAHYGADAGPARARAPRLDDSNPATATMKRWLPSIGHWLTQVPTAAALHPLYDPEAAHYTTGVPVDDETREWFRNIADARGIRSRAAVVRDVLVAEAISRDDASAWLSLACGAAQPVLKAMTQLGGRAPMPHVTLADIDPSALALARGYATQWGLEAHATTVRANLLHRDGFAAAGRGVGSAAGGTWTREFDVVDAVGLLEYLGAEDWFYEYGKVVKAGRPMAGAVTFLRNAFECVKPGGLLVVGNMCLTHPELSFTMDVVQWPHIQPREVAEVVTLMKRAGLTGHVDVYLPTDGVYAVYVVRKPVAV